MVFRARAAGVEDQRTHLLWFAVFYVLLFHCPVLDSREIISIGPFGGIGLAAQIERASLECLNRSNIIITQGQNIGPYTDRMCFKITINTDTTVIMVTPGTSTGNATVWSSDALPLKRDIYYEDDPTFTIKGPGTWYADVACSSCTSYTISVP